ncbi:MAG: THUMP domain-containing protein [bacterium]
MRRRWLYATCDHGFEAVLADELADLGAVSIEPGHRGVAFEADREGCWRITLASRIANRVLVPLAEFPAYDRASLHAGVERIDWPGWFDLDRTFAVDASSHRSNEAHTGFIAQVAKDAICDRFRAETGRRPSVDRRRPDVVINVHLAEDHCTVSLDAAGARLHRRGWRGPTGEAPLKETLAAGMLRLIGWQPDVPLFDPMCGSGTFLIEAALMARRLAPGLLRLGGEGFACQRWAGHDAEAFEAVVTGLRQQGRHAAPLLVGRDADPDAIRAARLNARHAGVDDLIRFDVGSLRTARAPERPGVILTNPPYGARLEADEALYRDLGDTFKQQFPGWTAWVFTSTEAPIRSIGLKPSRKIPLRNGPIDCRLCRYDLYAGGEPG